MSVAVESLLVLFFFFFFGGGGGFFFGWLLGDCLGTYASEVVEGSELDLFFIRISYTSYLCM